MQNKFLPKACVAKCQDHTQDAFIKCINVGQSLMQHQKWQKMQLFA